MENNPSGTWFLGERGHYHQDNGRPFDSQRAHPKDTNIAHPHSHMPMDHHSCHDSSRSTSHSHPQHSIHAEQPTLKAGDRGSASSTGNNLPSCARPASESAHPFADLVDNIRGIRAKTQIQARSQPRAQLQNANLEMDLLKRLQCSPNKPSPASNPPEYRTPYPAIPPLEMNENTLKCLLHSFIADVVPIDKPSPFNSDIFVENPTYSRDLVPKRVQVREYDSNKNPQWWCEDTMVLGEMQEHQHHSVLSAQHKLEFNNKRILAGFCTVATRKYPNTWSGPQRDESGRLIDKAALPKSKNENDDTNHGVADAAWRYSAVISATIDEKIYGYEFLIPTNTVELDGVSYDLVPDWIDVVNTLRKIASKWGREWGKPALELLVRHGLPHNTLEGHVRHPASGQAFSTHFSTPGSGQVLDKFGPSALQSSIETQNHPSSPRKTPTQKGQIPSGACYPPPQGALEGHAQDHTLYQELLLQHNEMISVKQQPHLPSNQFKGDAYGSGESPHLDPERNFLAPSKYQPPTPQNSTETHMQEPISAYNSSDCEKESILNVPYTATVGPEAPIHINSKSQTCALVKEFPASSISPSPLVRNDYDSAPMAASLQIVNSADNAEADVPVQEAAQTKRRRGRPPTNAAAPKKAVTPRKGTPSRKSIKQNLQAQGTLNVERRLGESGPSIMDDPPSEGARVEENSPTKLIGKRRRGTATTPSKRQKSASVKQELIINHLEGGNSEYDPLTKLPTRIGDFGVVQEQSSNVTHPQLDPRLASAPVQYASIYAQQDIFDPGNHDATFLPSFILGSFDPNDVPKTALHQYHWNKALEEQKQREQFKLERAAYITKKRDADPNYNPAKDPLVQRQYDNGPDPDQILAAQIAKDKTGLSNKEYFDLYGKQLLYQPPSQSVEADWNMDQDQTIFRGQSKVQDQLPVPGQDVMPSQAMWQLQNSAPIQSLAHGWSMMQSQASGPSRNSAPNEEFGPPFNTGGYQSQVQNFNTAQGLYMGEYQNHEPRQDLMLGWSHMQSHAMGRSQSQPTPYQSMSQSQQIEQGQNTGEYQNHGSNQDPMLGWSHMQSHAMGRSQSQPTPYQTMSQSQHIEQGQNMARSQSQPIPQQTMLPPQYMGQVPGIQVFQHIPTHNPYEREEIALFGRTGMTTPLANMCRSSGFDFSNGGIRLSPTGTSLHAEAKSYLRGMLQKRLAFTRGDSVSYNFLEKWLVELDSQGFGVIGGPSQYPSPSLR